jgi:hypothetical protein
VLDIDIVASTAEVIPLAKFLLWFEKYLALRE